MSTTRFNYGVTNATYGENLGEMGQLDPTKYETIFQDFLGDATGFGADATPIDGAGGLATIATTEAATTATACFVLSTQKQLFAKARFSLSAIAASTITFGFMDDHTSIGAGIYLTLVNGVTLNLVVNGSSTTTTPVTVAVANGQMVEVGFSYIPNKGFKVFLNDAAVLSSTNIANFDAATAMEFGVLSTGPTLTIDYLFGALER